MSFRLTPVEMAKRRCQGLCFNCDEKFVRDHKCAHLFFIEYDDTTPDDNTTVSAAHADDELRITLYAVEGVEAADTVRLHVIINGKSS
jgi:hypothetical protein